MRWRLGGTCRPIAIALRVDDHRFELPIDLILFVCESHIAAGGDENHDRAEDILRSWFVKFADSPNVDDSTKAKVQLLLGKNYMQDQALDWGMLTKEEKAGGGGQG